LPSSPTRLAVAALTLSAALAAISFTLEATRFGLTNAATAARLEREVRARFWNLARQVELLATRVAREETLVADASVNRDRLPALFNRLREIGSAANFTAVSTTVYVSAGPAGAYRVLAWSEGRPEDLTSNRLVSAPSLFVERGTVGLRLVYVQPIEVGGRRAGVAAAEAVLSPITRLGVDSGIHRIDTSFGPVVVEYVAAGEGPDRANRFVIAPASGAPLLEVRYSPGDLAAQRHQFRRRALAITSLPLVVAMLLFSGPMLERRSSSRPLSAWLGWSVAAGCMLAAGCAALIGLASLVDAPDALTMGIIALGALGLAALLPVSAWGRSWRRRVPQRQPGRFVVEQLLAGGIAAAAVYALIQILGARITAATIDKWQFPLFPIDPEALLYLSGLLIVQLALCWTAAAVLAVAALRWRVTWRRPGTALVAMALWAGLMLALAMVPRRVQPIGLDALVSTAVGVALFGVLAESIRRTYRRTTQAMRLILVFAALLLPTFAAFPMAAVMGDRAARTLIEDEYAPATAHHSQQLLAELAEAQEEIDRIPNLLVWVSGPPALETIPSQAAFQVWSQTSLSRSRATSAIELFGADRVVVSRFALNLPENPSQAGRRSWRGTNCAWELFGEVTRFGAKDRPIFTAERGVCDDTGQIRGAILVHVAPDYQALPFVPSANPYYDVVAESQPGARAGSRLTDLQVVVYGWSLQSLFAHGNGPWPISRDIDDRLYRSRDPFWIDVVDTRGRNYRVHFSNDRAGVYALGFPAPTVLQQVMRLAEVTAVLAVIFVLLLVGAAVYTPFARRREAPLRLLFDEIRTSFYRKLFLFFVLAAIVPVLLFALAFGAYMTNQLRADIESESAGIVTVARRNLEELAAAGRNPDQPVAPTDDVLVWIRQVIDQDVNLFEGSHLVATSQRDLFESGLLPKRTPAAVYRAIALDRLPTVVTLDRLGPFQYNVAAAPVPALGRDAVISVPLASRQREIDHQIDELNRGVLVGAVIVVLFAAALGTSVAGRVSDPVARLTRATRQIAAGRLDVRLPTDTADELGRLVDDFNSMAATLVAQRGELARTNQLKAWAEMARQVAHEIKNPLTPIQLAAEHLQRVHEDRGRPLGGALDQCVSTILRQVRLLRQIASEFSTFAGQPVSRPAAVPVKELLTAVVSPYELSDRIVTDVTVPDGVAAVWVDRTLVARALTNLVENAVQAMPDGGTLTVRAAAEPGAVAITIADTGVGMEPEAVERAFEPYFSTKTAGSGLGLANAKRNIELSGGTIAITSAPRAGTTLRVTLPVALPPAAGSDRPSTV
jgi:signal transduction histidine kinase